MRHPATKLGAPCLASETWARLPRILTVTLLLTGCARDFTATGALSSDAGDIGTFRSTPQGCTRDPADGLPATLSSTVLTFLWADPAARDASLRDHHAETAPNAPLRLEISREAAAYTLKLDAVKSHGTRLDPTTCTTLRVDTHETPPSLPEGRPTLSGTVQLECSAGSSHLTADIHFQRCAY